MDTRLELTYWTQVFGQCMNYVVQTDGLIKPTDDRRKCFLKKWDNRTFGNHKATIQND